MLVTQDICGNGSDVSHSETILQKDQIEIKSYVFCCLTTLITLVRTTQNYNNHLNHSEHEPLQQIYPHPDHDFNSDNND